MSFSTSSRKPHFKWSLSVLLTGSILLVAQWLGLWHAFGEALIDASLLRLIEGAHVGGWCL